MGGASSKSTDNTVVGTIDKSSKLSRDFAIIKLHGGTTALVAGMVATAVLLYLPYKLFNWKRARMGQAALRPRDRRAMWNIPGRVDEELGEGPGRLPRRAQGAFRPLQATPGHPMPVHEELCGDCQQEAGYDVLRGPFPPFPPLV